ncbi:hypothetical protein PC9H_006419 [Pleurotus ostreatus]|uniref:Uncharacterized protein n=1 Tax=Pleurotus ostreatus TaxID=5322 RepID=A0A8H6ZWX5_PLEOS|nr:uncharacterized protein PC9H_006419 [Pleurotus ostreatus]KAF7430708.1 hypothetical protein PC9H_006419 [Pleurotus ostreatus]
MAWNISASLALLYLILYATLLIHLLVLYGKQKISIRSRFTFVTFHVLIRLASQATGLAFALAGYSNVGLLIAYFILGAEGYFTLVLCAYRFLIVWHQAHFRSRESWLEPKRPAGEKWWRTTLGALVPYVPGERLRPMGFIHSYLVVANTLIIVGGTMLSRGSGDSEGFESDLQRIQTSKILRTVGQAIFLIINIALLSAILMTAYQARVESNRQEEDEETSNYPHPTLIILLIVWPLLIVRGLYGLLSPFVDPFNYFVPDNYDSHGLTLKFITYEYVLGTTMEWLSCALLIGTWWTEKWPGLVQTVQESDKKAIQN